MGRFEELGTALDFLFGKILNRNFNKADELIQRTEQEISAHKSSTQAHDATAIKYDGKVVGAGNTKQAIDNVQEQVNTLVLNGDSSVAAKQAAIDVNGHDYQNLKLRLDTEYEQVTSQLADNVQRINRSTSFLYQRNKKKTVLGIFVSDDGALADYNILRPLFAAKNVKFGMGLITSRVGTNGYMNWTQIREMVEDGHEVLNHSHNHQDFRTLTTEQMVTDIETSLKILASKGYFPDGFIYPFNSHDSNTDAVIRRYFNAAYTKTANSIDNIGRNFPIINNIRIARIAVGSYFDNEVSGFPSDTSSWEYYKARVDEAVANNNMLVIVLHPAHPDFNATQQQLLSDLIDYLKSLGVDIVLPSEGFARYGNIIQLGTTTTDRYWLDADGIEIYNSRNRTAFTALNSHTLNDAVTAFSQGKITYTPINNAFAAANGFPEGLGGWLVTYRITSEYYLAKQEYTPTLGSKNTYTRYVNSDYSWGDFRDNRPAYVVERTNNVYTAASPPSAFPANRITTFPVNTSGATGMPNNAPGIVTVYSAGDQYGYRKSEFRPYNSVGLWMRTGNNNDTWGGWINLIPE